jgi:hypothetical protein
MMMVKIGDREHSPRRSPGRKPDRPRSGCAVDEDGSCVWRIRNRFVVDKTKIGDGRHGDQSYPRLSLMQKTLGLRETCLGMKKAKPGTFGDCGPKGGGFPQDHRVMHRAAGITRPSQV